MAVLSDEQVDAALPDLPGWERADGGRWHEARRSLKGQHISSIIFEPISKTLFGGMRDGPERLPTEPRRGGDLRRGSVPIEHGRGD